jgi:hypothetical protein
MDVGKGDDEPEEAGSAVDEEAGIGVDVVEVDVSMVADANVCPLIGRP